MKRITLCIAMATALGLGLGASLAQASTFNYHGTLQDAGKGANGTYEMRLTLYSAANGGSVMAGPTTVYGIDVKDGSFVTSVDFGPLALTSQGWLGVEVKAGGGDFVALDARSPVAPEASGCPGSWALDGNAGILPSSYLGTPDSSTVYISSNNSYGGRFAPNGGVGLGNTYVLNGAYSVALGYNAGTANAGSIVTGGRLDTFGTTIRDTATNQFIMVAEHGVGINTATAPDGTPLRDELTIAPSPSLPGTNADLTLSTSTGANGYAGFNMSAAPNGFFQLTGLYNTSGTLLYNQLLSVDYITGGQTAYWRFNGSTGSAPITVGTSSMNGNGAFLSAGGVWTNASSRTFKDTFASVDAVNVLDKLVAMPLKTWFYKGNHDDGQHIGPVAEDFAEVFGFGGNEKYIGTVDESGVALAAIQGLNKKLEAENAGLHSKLDALTARLDKLESRRGE
ncbi:MAG: tail fiber domain-containing protein [Dokdonella sp.]